MDIFNPIIEWQQVQRDFSNSLELLYALLLWVMTTDSEGIPALATDFEQKLSCHARRLADCPISGGIR